MQRKRKATCAKKKKHHVQREKVPGAIKGKGAMCKKRAPCAKKGDHVKKRKVPHAKKKRKDTLCKE